ncbi:uncharacterized protein LOC111117481 isoform X2 [Crassostrea virginica]
MSEGFSDEDKVNLTLTIDCDFSGIEVSIHTNKTYFSELILQCDDKSCHGYNSVGYGLTNQTLDVSFPYRHSDHGGKYINFRTTCKNQTRILDHALLTPCLSGFTGNATVVGPNVTLYCEHFLFKKSTSGIHITYEGQDLAHCDVNNCYPGTGLPNGAYKKVGYKQGMEFLCKMDGAVINLKIIEVASTSTTNTFSTTTIITHDTSTSTSQSSSSMSTSFVKEGNGVRHVAVDSLVTSSVFIVHLFLLISS